MRFTDLVTVSDEKTIKLDATAIETTLANLKAEATALPPPQQKQLFTILLDEVISQQTAEESSPEPKPSLLEKLLTPKVPLPAHVSAPKSIWNMESVDSIKPTSLSELLYPPTNSTTKEYWRDQGDALLDTLTHPSKLQESLIKEISMGEGQSGLHQWIDTNLANLLDILLEKRLLHMHVKTIVPEIMDKLPTNIEKKDAIVSDLTTAFITAVTGADPKITSLDQLHEAAADTHKALDAKKEPLHTHGFSSEEPAYQFFPRDLQAITERIANGTIGHYARSLHVDVGCSIS